jgi:hypothetical protein
MNKLHKSQSLPLQMKTFGNKKKIKIHLGVKKCHFGNFSEGAKRHFLYLHEIDFFFVPMA